MAAAATEVGSFLPRVQPPPFALVTPFSPFFLRFRLRMSDRVKIRKESTENERARIKSRGALEYFPSIPPLLASSAVLRPFWPYYPAAPSHSNLACPRGDKMGHYAARKILQSSPRQASPAVHSLHRCFSPATPVTRDVRGGGAWMAESHSLRRTRLGYNKSRDINI